MFFVFTDVKAKLEKNMKWSSSKHQEQYKQ